MDPEPTAGGNLRSVAVELVQGDACAVRLEPGDATQYELLIAPCWGRTIRPALTGVSTGHEYLIVAVLNLGGGAAIIHQWIWQGDLASKLKLTNEWSAALIHWWLTLLWHEIGAVREHAFPEQL
jgi:hypothetical protein